MSVYINHPMGSAVLPALVQSDLSAVNVAQVNFSRRRALVAATTAAGGICVAGAAVPFIASMLPSERAKAVGAPVDIDISKLEPGTMLTVEWQRKPVWIVRRTREMLRLLENDDGLLSDPQSKITQQPAYCKNATRSIKPQYFVSVGVCTHLGCVPSFRPDVASVDLGPAWPGGFFCPCHGSKFDLAGRVFKNVPAPVNLVIPRHGYVSNSRLIIGAEVE